MLKQIVKDYKFLNEINHTQKTGIASGGSAAPKSIIFHIMENNKLQTSVLDIGFGSGQLGELIKSTRETNHWNIDGIDGWLPNCENQTLFQKSIYKNIWHGLAQEIPTEQLSKYNIICLLDVIEHLNAETAKWLLRTLLTHMGENSSLFISTPLWFYPQESEQTGDLEEHLIGVPASSLMALLPTMYSINNPLVGGFVFQKKSLEFIEFFQPTHNKNFSLEQGLKIASAVGLKIQPGILFKTSIA